MRYEHAVQWRPLPYLSATGSVQPAESSPTEGRLVVQPAVGAGLALAHLLVTVGNLARACVEGQRLTHVSREGILLDIQAHTRASGRGRATHAPRRSQHPHGRAQHKTGSKHGMRGPPPLAKFSLLCLFKRQSFPTYLLVQDGGGTRGADRHLVEGEAAALGHEWVGAGDGNTGCICAQSELALRPRNR